MKARSSEEIWGLVCGLSEPARSNRLLLMLKAYIDDSNMRQGPVAVLAGWLAPAKVWASFADDWDAVLNMKPAVGYFKWSQWRNLNGEFGGFSPESAAEKINLLINVLAHHNPLGVSCVSSNKLHADIFGSNPDPIMRGPYFLSFYSIVVQLVEYVNKNAPGERIDFLFDIQPGQMDAAYASWERLREVSPEGMKAIIGSVGFHNDMDVKPLQAADLSAGFTREQAEYGCFGKEPPEPPWGTRGNGLQCLTRVWTAELYEELARNTGAFGMPAKAS